MILPILLYGHPILRMPARMVPLRQHSLAKKTEAMFEALAGAEGLGLAAPQVGDSSQMFVVDTTLLGDVPVEKQVFINPRIVERSKEEEVAYEGCLSLPGVRVEVLRSTQIKVEYSDEKWQLHTRAYTGMLARIIQHEYDHLQGVLFIDHLEGVRLRLIKSKLARIKQGKVDTTYPVKPLGT